MMYLTLFGVVLLAAVASFLLGWLWYSKKVFGNVWMRELKMNKEEMGADQKKKMITGMAISLVSDIVKAFLFLLIAVSLQRNQFLLGFFIWLGFIVPLLVTNTIYEKRSWTLFMITAGYQLVSLMAMGLVFFVV